MKTLQAQHLPLNPSSTVADALDSFLVAFGRRVARGGRSAATLSMHAAHVELLRAAVGARALGELTEHHVAELAAADVSGATIRKRLSTLYGALQLARRRGAIAAVPLRPEIDHAYQLGRVHLQTFEQYRRLVSALPPGRAEWVAAGVFTGMHASDLNSWRAFDDADPFAGIMVLYNRKNRQTDGVRVRMPEELAGVLRRRFRAAGLERGALALRTWSNGTRGHQLAAAGVRAGLGELGRLTATALRHTCGTWLVRKFGITPAVCRWMGHRSVRMMERVYAHALPLQLEECTRELDSMELEADRLAPLISRSFDRGSRGPTSLKRSGEGAAETAPPPVSAQEGRTTRGRAKRRPIDDERQGSVPRDRVELSTHGFSVARSPSAERRPP